MKLIDNVYCPAGAFILKWPLSSLIPPVMMLSFCVRDILANGIASLDDESMMLPSMEYDTETCPDSFMHSSRDMAIAKILLFIMCVFFSITLLSLERSTALDVYCCKKVTIWIEKK